MTRNGFLGLIARMVSKIADVCRTFTNQQYYNHHSNFQPGQVPKHLTPECLQATGGLRLSWEELSNPLQERVVPSGSSDRAMHNHRETSDSAAHHVLGAKDRMSLSLLNLTLSQPP